MIRVWLWEVPLPPGLQWLGGPMGSAAATFLFWLLVALIVGFVILRLAKALARRTESDVEDVLIDVSRQPLVLTIVLLGMVNSVDELGLHAALVETARRWMIALTMAVVSYWVWRVFKEAVIHYGEEFARRSETRVDDVLLPIVNQFAPLVIFLVGGAAILQYLGVRLDALLVAIGGAAFILAFALQDILSNVFSGLSLLVDTPFKYGDLVMLEDEKVCQVVKIGVRVTQLYDIANHALIYMPNSKLANERLINLMQPTPELVSSLPVQLDRETDVERARQLLAEVLDAHPDLAGDLDRKLEQIDTFELLSREKRAHGVERLRAEREVDQGLRECGEALVTLADRISTLERGGLSKAERTEIREAFEPIRRAIGSIDRVDKRLGAHHGGIGGFIDACQSELPAESLAAVSWKWINIWARDPDLAGGEDPASLRERWAGRMLALLRRVETLGRQIDRPDYMEQRLDDAVRQLAAWILREFKQPIPTWKHSGVAFKGFSDGGLLFNMFFYVDDIELEHFFRQSRVEGQIRREAVRRLRQAGIQFASPRWEIDFIAGMPADMAAPRRENAPAA